MVDEKGQHLFYSDWTNPVNGLSYLAVHGGPGEGRVEVAGKTHGPPKERIMAKKSGKGPRVTIKMSSTESPYRFTTTKNKRNHPQRLELRRYDPVLRRHVLFKEEK